MDTQKILEYISRGRTDFILELLKVPNWKGLLNEGQVKPLQCMGMGGGIVWTGIYWVTIYQNNLSLLKKPQYKT